MLCSHWSLFILSYSYQEKLFIELIATNMMCSPESSHRDNCSDRSIQRDRCTNWPQQLKRKGLKEQRDLDQEYKNKKLQTAAEICNLISNRAPGHAISGAWLNCVAIFVLTWEPTTTSLLCVAWVLPDRGMWNKGISHSESTCIFGVTVGGELKMLDLST